MEWLVWVYLVYMFVIIYILTLIILIFLRNKDTFYSYPEAKKRYKISFIVPAYNEEGTLKETIKHIQKIDYKDIVEIIIVNDCSSDNTLKIAKELRKKDNKIKIIDNQINLGKAGSMNRALKLAKGEVIAIVDADSYPAEDSVKKMVGFLDDPKVGVVTCQILARNREGFLGNLQGIEYRSIVFTRKLMEYIDSIYVTPGPLALYRKKALEEIKGFDEKNMTEDVEATWHLALNGWSRKMSAQATVTTTVPTKFKDWWRQRRRWTIGGLQTLSRYFKYIGKKGMLGGFIVPFFASGLFLGLIGLCIFFYLVIKTIISRYLIAKYSFISSTSALTLNELYITPDFLNIVGITLFIFSFFYTIVILSYLNDHTPRKQNILNILFYSTLYLLLYPFFIIDGTYHFFKGKAKWR